jgi:biotin transport system substrate-specific component
MSTLRGTLVGWTSAELVPSRTARRVIGLVAFAAATAFGAKIAFPLPGTAVPLTLQPLFVLLAGALLGARMGAASQMLYLGAGLAGLPVFVAGGGAAYLLGPTGGYLLAYPLAAFLAGSAMRGGVGAKAVALLAGLTTIYAGGVAWLSFYAPVDVAFAMGLVPFVLADLVKVAVVLMVAVRLRDRALQLFGG